MGDRRVPASAERHGLNEHCFGTFIAAAKCIMALSTLRNASQCFINAAASRMLRVFGTTRFGCAASFAMRAFSSSLRTAEEQHGHFGSRRRELFDQRDVILHRPAFHPQVFRFA